MQDYAQTPALKARLSYEEEGRVLTIWLPDVVKSAENGDLGIQNAFIESAVLENTPNGAWRLVLRLTPYAKDYTLRAEAVFAPEQPAGTWLDGDAATGEMTYFETREQITRGKLSLLFSPGNYEASGEELKIREVSGKDYDFYATRQGYTDPMGWKSTWDSLAYMAEPVNILAQGGYKAFYAGLEQRNDVVVFPLP